MDLLRLEEQRRTLEQNLIELRQSLKHWQTLDAEYEGVKEEVLADPSELDAAALETLAKTYDGELVDEKVVRELAGLDKESPRSAWQIVGVIERRQEYVQQNLDTIQRRFFDAEAKLETFDFAASRDSETGLPLTEIHEELDEDDNVISSRLSQPEASQTQLLDTLRKAGLADEDVLDHAVDRSSPVAPLKSAIVNASPPISPGPNFTEKRPRSTPESQASAMDTSGGTSVLDRRPIRKKSVSFSADTKAAPEMVRVESEDGKKSVSFADKVAVAPAAPLPDSRSVSFSPTVEQIPEVPIQLPGPASPPAAPTSSDAAALDAQSDIQKQLRASFRPGARVIQLNDDDEVAAEHIVLPENESAEDAQTRLEMLDYHLNEVGHVVAQIDLDEHDADDDDDTSSHYTGSTYVEDEDTPYTSGQSDDDEDEDEDEFGRTRRSLVTDKYREEMLEMQNRLIGNLGAAPKDEDIQDADPELNAQDVRKLVIREKPSSISSVGSDNGEKKASDKKRVSFAEELDVTAPPGSPPLKAQKHQEGENVAPLTDIIAERTTAASHSLPGRVVSSKPSRFKKTRAAPGGDKPEQSPMTNRNDSATEDPRDDADSRSPYDTPSGPLGRTLADTLVEHPPNSKPVAAPSAEDPDPLMQRRALASEYYRRRNEIIRQQNGFKRDEDEEEELGELMEERDGKVKKVSRFKAARIKP